MYYGALFCIEDIVYFVLSLIKLIQVDLGQLKITYTFN